MSKKGYFKYQNQDPRCQYPFENDPLGYCWSYAEWVDNGKKDYDKFIETYCKNCDYFIKPKEVK